MLNLGIGTLTEDDVITENAAMVPQALLVNMAATVLEALSAYNTTMVPLASLVNATAMVPQAMSVTATAMVPRTPLVNASAMVPLASSANALTSMDVDATNASIHDMTEAEEKATAEIYS